MDTAHAQSKWYFQIFLVDGLYYEILVEMEGIVTANSFLGTHTVALCVCTCMRV